MATSEILTIIGLCLLYGGALISAYINIRLKIKELDVKLQTLEEALEVHEIQIGNSVSKLEEKNTHEHNNLNVKIDMIIEKITDIKVTAATAAATATAAAANVAAVTAMREELRKSSKHD